MDTSNLQEPDQARAAEEARVNGIVRQAQEGSMQAVDELVRTYQTPIFNLAYRMVNQHEEACDLTQEIFIKVYRAIRSFKGDSRFSTWLHALAINTCRSRRKRLQRIGFFEAVSLDEERDGRENGPAGREPVDTADRPNQALEKSETRELVGRAIATLPQEFREVLVMRDIQGLSYEEIALATGCQAGTVKSRLWRARAKVKDELVREGAICHVNG
jgi:RNA polymerase sigma-70 factor (ECF subfamily)